VLVKCVLQQQQHLLRFQQVFVLVWLPSLFSSIVVCFAIRDLAFTSIEVQFHFALLLIDFSYRCHFLFWQFVHFGFVHDSFIQHLPTPIIIF
jgi:hypothetical protein